MGTPKQDFASILNDVRSVELKEMAAQWGVPGAKSLRKAALIQAAIKWLTTPSVAEATFKRLTAREAKMLSIVVLTGGVMAASHWAILGKQLGIVKSSRDTNAIFHTLNGAGLLFGTGRRVPYYRREFDVEQVVVPPELCAVLSPYVRLDQLYAQKKIRLQFTLPPDTLLRDLFVLWSLIQRQKVQPLKRGNLPKRFLTVLVPLLIFPSSIDDSDKENTSSASPYAEMLLRLGYELELIRRVQDGESLHLQTTGGYHQIPAFWDATFAEQLNMIIGAWPKVERWEFLLSARQYFPHTTAWRKEVLAAIGKIPAGVWLPTGAIWTLLLPSVNRQPGSLADAIESSVSSPEYYYDPNYSTNQHSLPFLLLNLNHLVAMGILERGDKASAPEKATAYWRVTPFGEALLAGDPLPEFQTASWRVVIQPNFHIAAIGTVPINILARLGRLAELHKADTAVVEFQLTQQAVYPAFQDGVDWQQVQAFLEEISATALPQNVRRSLTEWHAVFERISVWPDVLVLQTTDPQQMDRLFQQKGIVKAGKLLRIGPTVAVADNVVMSRVKTWLRKQDMLPLVSSTPSVEQDSIRIEEDGRVVTLRPLPNIYLLGALRRLCEEQEGAYRITLASVQKFVQEGGAISDYIARLESLAINGVPSELVLRIKAWSHYYGDADVETRTLLHFKDDALLEELLHDEALRPYLRRLLPKVPIAWVKGDLETVAPLLAQRGISLHKKRRR